MLLCSENLQILSGFESRMKFINIMRRLVDYRYPDSIRKMVPNKALLDNTIVAVLVFIKDRTLGNEQSCFLSDVAWFLDDFVKAFPDEYVIDSNVLARYIVVDVLQNNGALCEYLTFDSSSESFRLMPVRLIHENKGRYYLSDDAFDFLFRSKEVEAKLNYSVTRFRIEEALKRDNYSEALEDSRELVTQIRNLKVSMDAFLVRCREDLSKVAVDEYESFVGQIHTLLENEQKKLVEILQAATVRMHTLEDAQESGVGQDDTTLHRLALIEVVNNISIAIDEQRTLINKKTTFSEDYRNLIRDNFSINRFERLNFEKDIMSLLRKTEYIDDAVRFLMFCLSKPSFARQGSIESFYILPGVSEELEAEEGIDVSFDNDSESIDSVNERNERFLKICTCFFAFAKSNPSFAVSDFVLSLSGSDLVEFCVENALPSALLNIFSKQSLAIQAWKESEKFVITPNGEFDLEWCLYSMPAEYLDITRISFSSLGKTFVFAVNNNDRVYKIEMTDFLVEVFERESAGD